jgi:hypothetical protein
MLKVTSVETKLILLMTFKVFIFRLLIFFYVGMPEMQVREA